MISATDTLPPAYVLWLGPTGLAVVRALGRMGVPVVGVHDDINEPCIATRYARVKVLPPVTADESAWLDFMVAEGRAIAPQKGVVIVASDATWLFVARHRRKLEPYFVFPLPEADNLELWPNKRFQYSVAERVGISFPRTRFPSDMNDIEKCADSLAFPCLIKPSMSYLWVQRYGRKLNFVHTPCQLVECARQAIADGQEFMIQEYIPGGDDHIYGLFSYVDHSSRPLAQCVVRKLRQYEPRFGSSCFSISVHEPRVEELGLRLLQEMGFHGISSVEFKLDPRDNEFKLIEVNVRSPLLMDIAEDSGVNIAYVAYRNLCGKPTGPMPTCQPGRRVGYLAHDLHTAHFYRSIRDLSRWRWMTSWVGARDLHFAWDDLRPMRGYFQTILDHWIRGKFRRRPSSFLTMAEYKDGIWPSPSEEV